MRKNSCLLILCLLVLASCTEKPGKKVVVISSGKMQLDEKDKTQIVFTPGGQHNELILEMPGNMNSITIHIDSATKPFDVKGEGLFVVNLKTDTIVGGIVNYGTEGIPSSISTEQLDHIIDSTRQLLAGLNTSDEKKTFNIPPMTVKKISGNSKENIIGPHTGIPGKVEVNSDGNAPVYYKFHTNSQKWVDLSNMLERLKK